MIVYAVMAGLYDAYGIVGVFSTFEEANKHIDSVYADGQFKKGINGDEIVELELGVPGCSKIWDITENGPKLRS